MGRLGLCFLQLGLVAGLVRVPRPAARPGPRMVASSFESTATVVKPRALPPGTAAIITPTRSQRRGLGVFYTDVGSVLMWRRWHGVAWMCGRGAIFRHPGEPLRPAAI